MTLLISMLLEWQNEQAQSRIERVLWIAPAGDDVVTIEILNPNAFPAWHRLEDLEAALIATQMRILESDPFAKLLRPENEISESHRELRDIAWDVIAPIVEVKNGAAFISSSRGLLVTEAEKRSGHKRKFIYKHLRRYWQGGQTKNALLPYFDHCGGKGKERRISDSKRGRPSSLAKATGESRGININQDMQKLILRGVRKFHEKEGLSLKESHRKTLAEFFNKGYDLQNGVLIPMLPSADEMPTFEQFRYWSNKHRDLSKTLKAREGERRFNLSHRAVLGNSTQMATGPGSIYQIDATVGDIYLVSSLDRNRIIGRPVIYIVIDVFSRLIAGLGVSLEGPSWLSAMLAVENTTADKVTFCQEYGIAITEDLWPSHHLPEAILADRGEFEGYNADNLVNALGVRVVNAPPYRADWKGIVEQNFRLLDEKGIKWQPGGVLKPRERGDKDYRLDAVLDLRQFTQLMIRCILHHNNDHRINEYKFDEFAIQDHVDPYPIELWNWGIKNRVGHLRAKNTDLIRLNLLPRADAVVTYRGIRFRFPYSSEALHYTCELALREQWFVKARANGRWTISVAYDPRWADAIYLSLDGGRRIEVCFLLDSEQAFKGRNWFETADYFEEIKKDKEISRSREYQAAATLGAEIEHIVSDASKQTEEVRINQSDRSRTKGIRENRKREREHERELGAWKLGEQETSNQAKEVASGLLSNQSHDNEDYVPARKLTNKLREARERKFSNDSQ